MSKYEEICQAFNKTARQQRQLVNDNEKLARNFVSGLKIYLGDPPNYEHNEDGKIYSHSCVEFFKVPSAGEPRKPAKFFMDAIEHNLDGSFRFGIGVAIEPDNAAVGRKFIFVDVDCNRNGLEATMRFDGGNAVHVYSDGNTWNDLGDAYSGIYKVLLKKASKVPE